MATLSTIYDIASPAVTDDFSEIYEQIRDFITAISERMNLDHAFDGTEDDDTDADCDGYHKKLTMRGDLYDAENLPDCPTNGFVFFSIGGELCCYDGSTAKQITNEGEIYFDTNDEDATINLQQVYIDGGNMVLLQGTSGVYKLSSGEFTQVTLPASGHFFYKNNYFFILAGRHIYRSTDCETWDDFFYNFPNTNFSFSAMDYANGIYVFFGSCTNSGSTYRYLVSSSDLENFVYDEPAMYPSIERFSLIYTGSSYFLVSGAQTYTSSDCEEWERHTNTGGQNYFHMGSSVTSYEGYKWAGDVCFGVYGTTPKFTYTSDGINFTTVTLDIPSWVTDTSKIQTVQHGFANGVFFIGVYQSNLSGKYRLYYSSDKTTWNYYDYNYSYTFSNIVFYKNYYITCSGTGLAREEGFYFSKDLSSWTKSSGSGQITSPYGIFLHNDHVYALPNGHRIQILNNYFEIE